MAIHSKANIMKKHYLHSFILGSILGLTLGLIDVIWWWALIITVLFSFVSTYIYSICSSDKEHDICLNNVKTFPKAPYAGDQYISNLGVTYEFQPNGVWAVIPWTKS